jgi:hypothetical protein
MTMTKEQLEAAKIRLAKFRKAKNKKSLKNKLSGKNK